MRTHTQAFKEELTKLGKQQKVLITYGATTLTNDQINSVTYSFDTTLLKSIMTCLEIDSNIEIPIDTEINFQYGLLVNDEYEYLDFGNFIISEVEKQEDTNSYSIVAYDRMIYAMQDYEPLDVTFPITNTNFLVALATQLGYTLQEDIATYLVNGTRLLAYDVFKEIGYTYRDVLDDIAEANGVNFIFDNDILTVKNISVSLEDGYVSGEKLYLQETSNDVSGETLILSETTSQVLGGTLILGALDVIDEEYLKDVNVNFGEMFGPINSVVLSRSTEDNIYQKDNDSIAEYGLFEFKITDNQILNNNDRGDYLPEIYNALHGITYALNDFKSTGICYLEVLEKYGVKVGNRVYACVLMNDEINITQGLEENIYTELPNQSQTNYKKASRTEHETSLIVDKANKQIQSLITEVGDRTDKTTSITQDIDTIASEVSVMADVTEEKQDNGALTFENVNISEPVYLRLYPIDSWISYLYPNYTDNKYPSSTLYPQQRIIRFENSTTNEVFDYQLPCDLRYFEDSEHGIPFTYDEFILDYENQVCKKIERIGISGTYAYVLSQEREVTYDYPSIVLSEGDYTISVLGHTRYFLKVKVNKTNEYTKQFATRVDLTSTIEQTANMINLELQEKVNNTDYTAAQILMKINDDISETQIKADKINLAGKTIDMTSDTININSKYFQVTPEGKVTCQSLGVTGKESFINLNDSFVVNNLGNVLIYDSGRYAEGAEANFNIKNESGDLVTAIYSGEIDLSNDIYKLKIHAEDFGQSTLDICNSVITMWEDSDTIQDHAIVLSMSGGPRISCGQTNTSTYIYENYILCQDYRNISLAEAKKDIKLLNNGALKDVLDTDIYEYHYKTDTKNDNKKLGVIIGDNYKCSEKIMSEDNKSVNLYSMIALTYKAIQELAQEVEDLKNGKTN